MRALGSRQRKIHAAGWLLLIVLLPVMKWTESPSWSMFLWAEDAALFLRQGIDLGATALATPYAGYIHLVPRLAAWGATLLPASLYPAALVSGWWLAYLVTGFLLIRWAKEMNLPAGWGVVAVVAVVLQPHGGEVFFSATNAQWWLGLYLFVYFIWLDQRLVGSVWLRGLDCVSIVVATLSGPFVFLVWPVIALRRWTEGRRYVWSWLHAWVLLAGLLQLALFLSGDRVHRHEGAVFHIDQWAIAFVRLLAFCADGPVQMSLAVAFLLVCTWVVWRDRRAVDRLETQDALIVVGCIGYLLLAGIWAHKFDPMQTVPLGTGSRYTWIPYALFFLLVCRSASRSTPVAQVAVALLLFGVCYMGHRPIQRGDLQYQAFTDLARIKPVHVPVHPQVAAWPGWGLELAQRDVGVQAAPRFVYAAGRAPLPGARDGSVREEANGWRFIAHGADPQVVFASPLHCQLGRSVGVEVRMWRASSGWIQLFWSKDERFNGRHSLSRFYPAGPVVAQFAFRNPGRPTYLRLDPADAPADALIHSVEVHCLSKN
jgi:hypothetical protein